MNLIKRTLLFLPILMLLTACPYDSAVPIAGADMPIDKAFVGKWLKEEDRGNEYPGEYYQISDFGGKLYEVLKYSMNNEDSTYRSETYISHFSDLKTEGAVYKFLNMKKDGKYYLHKVDLEADRFILFEVTDNVDETFNSSEELKAYVESNMHLSFFYNKDEVTFYRED